MAAEENHLIMKVSCEEPRKDVANMGSRWVQNNLPMRGDTGPALSGYSCPQQNIFIPAHVQVVAIQYIVLASCILVLCSS